MEKETEQLDAQPEVQEGEAPQAEAEQKESMTPEEIAELKRRAEVSSQNFERAKKAEAEKKALQEQLAQAEAQLTDSSGFQTDGGVLAEIAELKARFAQIEEEKQLTAVLGKYPNIADKMGEFNEYRKDFPTEKLEVAAKAFLVENDMLADAPKKKGLEPARGGKRTAPDSGKMAAEDVQRLRTTNFKEYMKLVRAGKINV